MSIKYEIITDFFGKDHFLTQYGPVLKETMVKITMDYIKEVMEEFCEEWPDEGIVFISTPSQSASGSMITHTHAIAEWDYLPNTEYILVSGVDKSECLLHQQLIMIKEDGLPAKVFRLSIGDFANDHGFEPDSSVSDTDNEIALHKLTAELVQTILMGKETDRVVPISPEELIEELPFELRV